MRTFFSTKKRCVVQGIELSVPCSLSPVAPSELPTEHSDGAAVASASANIKCIKKCAVILRTTGPPSTG